MSYNQYLANPAQTAAQRGIMTQVYAWMTAGLLLTGAVAQFVAGSSLGESIIRSPLFLVLFLVQIGVVWFLSARISRMAPATATATFLGYSVLSGITLAPIFLAYTNASIGYTFLITGGMFAAMSAIGYTTKRDLSGMGSFLFMALIGFLLATVVNIFLQSTALYWIITYAGIAIFVGLTIWDTQKIKNMAARVSTSDDAHRVAILGALSLYLNFINLFLLLLRLLGNRR